MTVVLAIDVGIRNLAVCCMRRHDDGAAASILFWELVNTLGDAEPAACQASLKSGSPCRCKAKFVARGGGGGKFCTKHAKGQSCAAIKAPPKVKGLTMQVIAEKCLAALESLSERHAETFSALDHCVIELQPRVNNKMKFTSHVIFAKLADTFLQSGRRVCIRFVGAKRKLLAHARQEKNTYAKRKKLAVAMAREWVATHAPGWVDFFDACRKKDDVSDCLLMAVDEVSR